MIVGNNQHEITGLAIEIRNITIPKGLEDAMSKEAQAERECLARIILGTAETEIAEKFSDASQAYLNNHTALHLRAMNTVFEGLRSKSSMVIVPSSAVDSMNLGALGELTAFASAGNLATGTAHKTLLKEDEVSVDGDATPASGQK